jgi:putative glutamine amidotransferase
MSKPLIAITVDVIPEPDNERTRGRLSLNWNYAQMVAEAGGNPLLVTPLTDTGEIASLIDGWLIPGGDDIDASHFGEENHPKVGLQDPRRWEMESGLYSNISPELPILGICYGCQFLNVKRGGSLIQHVPDVVNHESHSGGTMQTYHVASSSFLAKYAGTDWIEGKSYHHQAVGQLGQGLEVVAKTEDGTVEAIEDKTKPFLVGVQWHPERTPDDEATRSLFREFIAAAKTYSESKQCVTI